MLVSLIQPLTNFLCYVGKKSGTLRGERRLPWKHAAMQISAVHLSMILHRKQCVPELFPREWQCMLHLDCPFIHQLWH